MGKIPRSICRLYSPSAVHVRYDQRGGHVQNSTENGKDSAGAGRMEDPRAQSPRSGGMAPTGPNSGSTNENGKSADQLQAGQYANDAQGKRHRGHNGAQGLSHFFHTLASRVRCLVPKTSTVARGMAPGGNPRSKNRTRVPEFGMASSSQN